MQEKIVTRAKFVIDALRSHYGEKVGEFAARLEVAPSTVSTWANRDTLDEDLIFRKCEGVSYEFLKTGKGEMFREQPRQFAAVQAEPVAAEQAANDYRGTAPRMAVVEFKRSISEDGWALLDSFELLCDEQKKSLLIVAQTMALGVPTKSQPKEPGGKS